MLLYALCDEASSIGCLPLLDALCKMLLFGVAGGSVFDWSLTVVVVEFVVVVLVLSEAWVAAAAAAEARLLRVLEPYA